MSLLLKPLVHINGQPWANTSATDNDRPEHTESAPIESERFINFCDFLAVHSGHFYLVFVHKYSNIGRESSKNDHSVPNKCLMAFQSRVAFYRRGYCMYFCFSLEYEIRM